MSAQGSGVRRSWRPHLRVHGWLPAIEHRAAPLRAQSTPPSRPAPSPATRPQDKGWDFLDSVDAAREWDGWSFADIADPPKGGDGYPRLLVENRLYCSRAFRKLHLEVAARQDGLQVLHMVMYPR